MAKQAYKIYLTQKDYNKILEKAKEMGYTGRGSFSLFLEFLANNQIIFVDENIKTLLKAVKL